LEQIIQNNAKIARTDTFSNKNVIQIKNHSKPKKHPTKKDPQKRIKITTNKEPNV